MTRRAGQTEKVSFVKARRLDNTGHCMADMSVMHDVTVNPELAVSE
jgi:hypothetical protein